MLLTIDVGNTNIVSAIIENGKILFVSRFDTILSRQHIEKNLKKFKNYTIEGVIISSVVPKIDKILIKVIKKLFFLYPTFVNSNLIENFLPISIKNPSELGSDRIVNAYAALKIYKKKPAIIIDFGTATTFCAIDNQGRYIGGAIAPGVSISRDALHEKTAKLPLVDLKFPSSVIGKDTKSAMQSGIMYGYVGIVQYLVKQFKKELGKRTYVIATGGLAKLIAPKTDIIDIVNQDLTILGLYYIWEDLWKTKQQENHKS